MIRRIIGLLTLSFVLGLGVMGCDNQDDEKKKELLKMVVLAAILDPCYSTPSPLSRSGLPSASLAAYSAASVKGRLVTAGGVPVNGALVMVDGGTSSDANHYGSHTGILRDGYFEIGGILIADGPFRLAVESVSSTFAGRIDYHLDCYPVFTFTSGWYTGSGSTITTTRLSGQQFTLTAGEVKDMGTMVLLQ